MLGWPSWCPIITSRLPSTKIIPGNSSCDLIDGVAKAKEALFKLNRNLPTSKLSCKYLGLSSVTSNGSSLAMRCFMPTNGADPSGLQSNKGIVMRSFSGLYPVPKNSHVSLLNPRLVQYGCSFLAYSFHIESDNQRVFLGASST